MFCGGCLLKGRGFIRRWVLIEGEGVYSKVGAY